ncbi:MAG: bifunctional nuclease family protein [Saprospiraceae bacterium]
MKNVELHIAALNSSITHNGNFVLVLQEISSAQKLPIIIGLQEAQTIAIALEKIKPSRPLTHDLLLTTLETLHAHLDHVVIREFKNGIFYSVLVLKDQHQAYAEIDSRTSDAIALAVRQNCSIYMNEDLFRTIAIDSSVSSDPQENKREQFYKFDVEELNQLLLEALSKEDYETAAIVRDIISKKV